ncbi:MAG TPA: hypothetical protein VFD82_23695 [Planctomycetota bacterium]|nr:hypothetical protein [Planctomycetota bacterium]
MTLSAFKSLAAGALLALFPSQSAADPGIFPVNSSPYGLDYAGWSAEWWTWNMEHPLFGHPSIDGVNFNVTSNQSGNVWFLATPVQFGTATPTPLTRNITVPKGKALFVGTLTGEMSSLEGAATEAEQRDIANFQADRIVGLTCTLDGQTVNHAAYRFESPQFSFTAPDPWIFSPAPGGTGTAVADGYYLFLRPLSVGQHVLHYTGGFHFEAGIFGPEPFDISADMTYVITVTP